MLKTKVNPPKLAPGETVKDLLSTRQVMEILGVSKKTVIDWRKKGWLHFVEYPKNNCKHSRSEVERILREGIHA